MGSGLLFAPFTSVLTVNTLSINRGLKWPCQAAIIQILNAVGALMLVYVIRL